MNTSNVARAIKEWLISKAVNDSLPQDMNELSITEIVGVIENSQQDDDEKSSEVTRQIQINRIESFIRNKGVNTIELEDYNLKMNFGDVPVCELGVGYIVNKNDDEFDFEEMNNEEIDELYKIVEQMELIDEKTMKRTEN